MTLFLGQKFNTKKRVIAANRTILTPARLPIANLKVMSQAFQNSYQGAPASSRAPSRGSGSRFEPATRKDFQELSSFVNGDFLFVTEIGGQLKKPP